MQPPINPIYSFQTTYQTPLSKYSNQASVAKIYSTIMQLPMPFPLSTKTPRPRSNPSLTHLLDYSMQPSHQRVPYVADSSDGPRNCQPLYQDQACIVFQDSRGSVSEVATSILCLGVLVHQEVVLGWVVQCRPGRRCSALFLRSYRWGIAV